jgi:hypothetical protein
MNYEHSFHEGPPLIRGDERIVAAPLPGYRCTPLPDGFRFDLPLWKSWRALGDGLAYLLIGLLLVATGGWVAYWVFAHVSPAHGVLWLGVPLLTPAVCAAFGGRNLLQGACLLFGRRRIEATNGRLRVSWRIGPFTVTSSERDFARLRRLVVLKPASKSSAKYPELMAELEGIKAFPLVAYHSRDMLFALARRLAQIVPDSTDAPPVDVVDEAPDFTGVRLHQPARSRVRFTADADGIVFVAGGVALVIGRPSSPLYSCFGFIVGFLLSVLACLVFNGFVLAAGFTIALLYLIMTGTPADGIVVAALFAFLYAFFLLPPGLWYINKLLCRGRLVVRLDNNYLTIRRERAFASQEERWGRDAIADVTAFSETASTMGTDEYGRETGLVFSQCYGLRLNIHGCPTRAYVAADCSAADWEWIATTLRNALVQGRASAASPSGIRLLGERGC